MKRFIFIMVIFMVIPFAIHAQATFNLETGTGTGSGWSWNPDVLSLTISNGTTITITGQVTDGRSINVAASASANITISNLYLSGESVTVGDGWIGCPILLNNGATLNLTLDGDNILKAGHYYAGIHTSTGTTLSINGTGSLVITGGWASAAIGGSVSGNNCGNISISGGTITATGAAGTSYYGVDCPGIGGGYFGTGGNVTISGGVVCSNGGGGSNGGGMAIGSGGGGIDEAGTFTMTGNAMVFASGACDLSAVTGGIVVIDNATHWFAGNNFSLNFNATVPVKNVLTVEAGKTLTIPSGITLTNNGTIINYGVISINGTLNNNTTILNVNSGTVTGTVSGNAPTPFTPLGNSVNLGTVSAPSVGEGWVFANNVCTVLNGADVVVTGTSAGQRRIDVASNATASLTLNDVSITGLLRNQTPLLLNLGAKVNLTIEGDNTLTGGLSRAGVQVQQGTEISIGGSGSLTASCTNYGGAGIGSKFFDSCGKITITGGTINATGGEGGSYAGGAGIGGGGGGIVFGSNGRGNGGDITISGGVVTATGNNGAAGIGGGALCMSSGTLSMDDYAVVFVSSLTTFAYNNQNLETNIDGVVKGILFNNITGTFYGNLVLPVDLTIPEGYSLTVPVQAGFTIPENITLYINGSLHNDGTIREEDGTTVFDGTFTGNKIVFSNFGGESVTEPSGTTLYNLAPLFAIYKNAGSPIYTIEAGSTGEGTIVGDLLTITKNGEFTIGLVTEEAQYYAAHELVTSTLIVEPIIGIEPFSQPGNLTAYTNNGRLHVNGLVEGKIWSVYNVMGALIYRDIANDIKADVPLLTNGMFIIYSEGKSVKVMNY